MKKVGIITFHRALNYGSVMQAYALQTKIKELYPDYAAETIDYYPPNIKKIRSIFVPVKSLRNIVRNVTALAYYPSFAKRRKSFDKFLDTHLKIGKKYNENDNMANLDEQYDILVAGSDQIWNNVTKDFSLKYFFPDSEKAKKVSYAPSVGNGMFERGVNEDIFNALSKFSCISVREKTGSEKLKSFLDAEHIPVVIDPTLLISKEEYETISSKKFMKGDYIFMYTIKNQERFLKAVKDISEKTGLPVVTVFAGQASFRVYSYGVKMSTHSSPEDFLALIRDAKLVVTDSFHGTAFSVVYQKPFYSFCTKDASTRDARIDTLLSKIGLEDRMLFFEDYERDGYLNELNYSSVEEKLEAFKAQSVDYLTDSLI